MRYGWPAGFMTAAAGMSAGVLQFLWGRRLLGDAGRAPMRRRVLPRSRAGAARGAALDRPGAALIALVVFLIWSGRLPVAPVALAAVTTQAILGIAILYFAYLLFGAGLTRVERLRVLALAVLFVASALFWAGYERPARR